MAWSMQAYGKGWRCYEMKMLMHEHVLMSHIKMNEHTNMKWNENGIRSEVNEHVIMHMNRWDDHSMSIQVGMASIDANIRQLEQKDAQRMFHFEWAIKTWKKWCTTDQTWFIQVLRYLTKPKKQSHTMAQVPFINQSWIHAIRVQLEVPYKTS